MLSFKNFLTKKPKSSFVPHEDGFHHEANIKGNAVKVNFDKPFFSKPGHHYMVSFNVNGHMNERPEGLEHEHGLHILNHVNNVVKSFVQEKKPKKICMVTGGYHKSGKRAVYNAAMTRKFPNSTITSHKGRTDIDISDKDH